MSNTNIEKALKDSLSGEVRFDDITRTIYSSDASIYEVRPIGVVFPKDIEDICKTITLAASENIPIIPRGAATGITGGCLGKGIILDCSKYLNAILRLDVENRTVVCEPGVVQDVLNAAVSPYGLRLGPDTSTGNRATVGGMLANNAAGARSLRYSSMKDHVIGTDLILSNGDLLSFQNITLEEWTQLKGKQTTKGHLYQTCWELRALLGNEIKKRFPDIPRRVSGYNLPCLLEEDHFNLCQLIAGSEGTLGFTSEITLKLSLKPENQKLCLLFFPALEEALEQVTKILELQPLALELIDKTIIEAGKTSPVLKNELGWLKQTPEALLVIEFDGHDALERVQQATKLGTKEALIIEDAPTMKSVWDLRKAGLGLLMSKRSYSRAIAFLEDIAIPPQELALFMQKFLALLGSTDKRAGIYGHAGAGCMHIRPYMDLRSGDDRKAIEALMHATTLLLIKHRGALSGEHGDGLIRSWLNKALFGETIYNGFLTLKNAFDPHHLMNPHKIVDGPPLFEDIRKSPAITPLTFLNFEPEGGFDLAVDMCNGNGLCRKKEGIMCPSFQATGDEKDATRARATLLRDMITHPQSQGIGSDEVHEILDLCLSCKGCKTECPSQVDMAKLKAEASHHYRLKHGLSLRNKIVGHIGRYLSKASPFAKWGNILTQSELGKQFLSFLGFSKKRTLPTLAEKTFDTWIKENHLPSSGQKIILFNDTFTNFNHPQIGIAAYQLLTALGFDIIVPPWKCCGRTSLSKGMLPEAKDYAEKLVHALSQYGDFPLIFLEPSCWSAFKDDYGSLIHKKFESIFLLEEFLLQEDVLNTLKGIWPEINHNVSVHVHCHQKALCGVETSLKLLNSLKGVQADIIPSGCCGMAGAFGYEKEHFELSQAIGELVLLPTIKKLPNETYIIINGTSCREQVNTETHNNIFHLAEYLSDLIFKRS